MYNIGGIILFRIVLVTQCNIELAGFFMAVHLLLTIMILLKGK